MKYLVITTDGQLHTRTAAGPWQALADVGDEGYDRVQLTRDCAAYVNDCGLILPEHYDRNPVGGTLLHALGAPPIPYAGPIVFVGWDQAAGHRGEIEIRSLTDLQIGMLTDLHDWIAAIVTDGDTGDIRGSDQAGDAVETAAAHVRCGEVPPVTFYTA